MINTLGKFNISGIITYTRTNDLLSLEKLLKCNPNYCLYLYVIVKSDGLLLPPMTLFVTISVPCICLVDDKDGDDDVLFLQ